MAFTWLLFIIIASEGSSVHKLPWSWDTLPLQALFSTWAEPELTDYQAQFIATHYDIITLGGCLYHGRGPTEITFYKMTSHLRQYASSSETKILMYFASDVCYWNCYHITDPIYHNSSMHLRDDDGNILYTGNADFPYYDQTQKAVRDLWIKILMDVMITAKDQYNTTINGLFIDGILRSFNSKTLSKTRQIEYAESIKTLMIETKAALSEWSDDTFLIGCCMDTHNHMMDLYPYLDGVMFEHYGSFEQVDTNGNIVASEILSVFDISKSFGGNMNKSFFIKSWVGPETSPFRSTPFGPTWPDAYGELPLYLGLQNASAELISYPLATYLCGIYNRYIYFNYAYWYDINQGYVPCPDDPSKCCCPLNWYEEFTNYLGKPLSDGMIYDTYKCNRSFEYADVYVDTNDPTSAEITWYTRAPTVEPTETSFAPSVYPSQTPTVDPTKAPTVNVESRKMGAVIVAIFLCVILAVVGCVGYSTMMYKMQNSVEEVNDTYQAM